MNYKGVCRAAPATLGLVIIPAYRQRSYQNIWLCLKILSELKDLEKFWVLNLQLQCSWKIEGINLFSYLLIKFNFFLLKAICAPSSPQIADRLFGALKTMNCSGLDLLIVPAWSLKKRTPGLSRLVALKTRRPSGLDLWIVPEWSPTNKEVFRIGLMEP